MCLVDWFLVEDIGLDLPTSKCWNRWLLSDSFYEKLDYYCFSGIFKYVTINIDDWTDIVSGNWFNTNEVAIKNVKPKNPNFETRQQKYKSEG